MVTDPLGVAKGMSGGRLAPAPAGKNGRNEARDHPFIITLLASAANPNS
jgi:hypothetical protein